MATYWKIPDCCRSWSLGDRDTDIVCADAGKIVLNLHQLFRVRVRQGMEQRGVDNTEERGGCYDAERDVAMAMQARPGDLRSVRKAKRMSSRRFSKKGRHCSA